MRSIRSAILSLFLLFLLTACSTDRQAIPETKGERSPAGGSFSRSDISGAGQDTAPLSDAVKNAIINENHGKYLPGECFGVGYKIIETFEEDDTISVYALTEYVEYHFEDGVFVNISGTNPKVLMCFQITDSGQYELISYTRLDIFSGSSDEELQALMKPLEETGKEYLFTDQALQEVRAQADRYAAEYLRTIGRAAEIGVRQDHEGQRLEELISDRDLLDRLFKDDELGRYPDWTGTTERLENGVRYIYQTDFDEENQTVVYTKTEYENKDIIEIIKVDIQQGIIVE